MDDMGMIETGEPLPADENGSRRPDGKFGPGNKFGRGNPNNRRAQELRNVLMSAVTEDDVRAALAVYRDVMANGKLAAAEALLGRVFGKPIPMDLQAEVDELREAVDAILAGRDE